MAALTQPDNLPVNGFDTIREVIVRRFGTVVDAYLFSSLVVSITVNLVVSRIVNIRDKNVSRIVNIRDAIVSVFDSMRDAVVCGFDTNRDAIVIGFLSGMRLLAAFYQTCEC